MTELHENIPDPISTAVNEVLAIFHDALTDVRFPEVDRGALEALAEDVRAKAAGAALAKIALAGSLEALDEARGRLARRAEVALAYARVYADSAGDPALAERLASIPLGASSKLERRALAQAAPRRTRKHGRAELTEASAETVPQLALDDAAAE